MRGAWIEIASCKFLQSAKTSLPVRGAWIEIMPPLYMMDTIMSLPVRGAWIEIRNVHACRLACLDVAPRAGSVD